MRDLVALPKAHLHVHLESAVRPSTLAELADRYGVTVPVREGRFDGFRDFADHGSLVRSCLRGPDDFARVARELVEDEAAGGTRWLEVTFTAASHGERLGDPDGPLAAVLDGLRRGGEEHGVGWCVVLDHSRRRPVERFARTLTLATAFDGVAAIGLAGDEAYPAAPFADVCRAARDAGVRLVHHAGETAGPASVAEVLDLGLADRVGHGVRALEDADLCARLRDTGVPLEVCPSSNVGLAVVPSFAEHPLPAMLAAGLVVTLSTDVPAAVGTTLVTEYERVRDALGLDDAALARLSAAGVRASFAPDDVKAALLHDVDAWLRPAPDRQAGVSRSVPESK